MNSRPKGPRTARNKNVLVIGGSGSGKTRYLLKPNLMQCHSSYVITDPKGSLLIECGHLLEKKKYQIRFFNTINFKKSLHYNPFHYIHSEKDILKLANVLITNIKIIIWCWHKTAENLMTATRSTSYLRRLSMRISCRMSRFILCAIQASPINSPLMTAISNWCKGTRDTLLPSSC